MSDLGALGVGRKMYTDYEIMTRVSLILLLQAETFVSLTTRPGLYMESLLSLRFGTRIRTWFLNLPGRGRPISLLSSWRRRSSGGVIAISRRSGISWRGRVRGSISLPCRAR